jgi:hypothetical protein
MTAPTTSAAPKLTLDQRAPLASLEKGRAYASSLPIEADPCALARAHKRFEAADHRRDRRHLVSRETRRE